MASQIIDSGVPEPTGLIKTYLNKTPNKTARSTTSFKPEFVILHETAGYGSLEWNLRPEVRSSYNYLILRDGKTHHYVNERAYIAWHSGVRSTARGYDGGEINTHSIGIELEGPNDGRPITEAQWVSFIALAHYLHWAYEIPLTQDYWIAHSVAAPGHKTDPRGYSIPWFLTRAQKAEKANKFIREPTISKGVWDQIVMRGAHASHAVEICSLYHIPVSMGIDPAIALAFFKHESQYGTAGVNLTHGLKNWGNVRTPYNPDNSIGQAITPKGPFARYPTWASGLVDWCERIINIYVNQRSLDTLEKAIPIYAPVSDGNSPYNYVRAVHSTLEGYKSIEENPLASYTITRDGDLAQFHCGKGFYDFWNQKGGVLVFGWPTTNEYSSVDPGSGRICSFMHFENVVLRSDNGLPAPWNIRPIPISEAFARVSENS